MATTTHDEGFHEIQLNGKQLVFLFMAGTVAAVVIFLLGVFVGRGVRAQSSEVDPVMAQENASPALEVPPIASSTGGDAPASAGEDLSYPKRLASADTPREQLRSETATPDSARNAPTATDAAPSAPSSAAGASDAARKAPASSAPDSNVSTEPAGEGFAIQLAALGKREEAENIVRRLAAKGYSAYLMAPAPGAPAVYRVRVGKFKDRREAESVSARLQREEQFKPWIVR
jgi:cell division septation protein DedD